MSIVNQVTLAELRELRRTAISTDSYQTGYNRALRGLEKAIGALEQIELITANVRVIVETK